jgi:hypothetical protein
MPDADLREHIARLEVRIEDLAETIERCRKAILIAKVAIALGALVVVTMTLGVMRFDPVGVLAAITGVIGGTVVFGSNTSTLEQTSAALKAAEAERVDLIGRIDLQVVGEDERLH